MGDDTTSVKFSQFYSLLSIDETICFCFELLISHTCVYTYCRLEGYNVPELNPTLSLQNIDREGVRPAHIVTGCTRGTTEAPFRIPITMHDDLGTP